jgi:hypothetical protein
MMGQFSEYLFALREEIIRKYFQCWLNKDIDVLMDTFSDALVYSEYYGSVYKGTGQITRWFD